MGHAEHGAGAAKVLAACPRARPSKRAGCRSRRVGASTLAPASLRSLRRLAMTWSTHPALAFIPRRVSRGCGREPSQARISELSPTSLTVLQGVGSAADSDGAEDHTAAEGVIR